MKGRVSRSSSDGTRARLSDGAAPPPLPEDSPPATPLPPAHTPSREQHADADAPPRRLLAGPDGTVSQPAAAPLPDAVAALLFSPVIDSSIPWGPPKAPLPHYPPPKTPLPPPDSPPLLGSLSLADMKELQPPLPRYPPPKTPLPPPDSPPPLDEALGSLSLAEDTRKPLEDALGSLSLADSKELQPPLPDYTPPATPLPPSPSETSSALSGNPPDRASSSPPSRSSSAEGRGAAQDGGALSLSPEDADPAVPSRPGVERGGSSSSSAASGISLKKNPRLFAVPRVSFPLEPKGRPGRRQPRVAPAQARPSEPLISLADGPGDPDAGTETRKPGCGTSVGCEPRTLMRPRGQQQENRNPVLPESRLRRSRVRRGGMIVGCGRSPRIVRDEERG